MEEEKLLQLYKKERIKKLRIHSIKAALWAASILSIIAFFPELKKIVGWITKYHLISLTIKRVQDNPEPYSILFGLILVIIVSVPFTIRMVSRFKVRKMHEIDDDNR